MNKTQSFLNLTKISVLSLCVLSTNLVALSQDDNFYFKSSLGTSLLESKHKEKKVKNDGFLTNDNLAGGLAVGKRYYNIGAELGYTNMGKKTYYSSRKNQKSIYQNQSFTLDLNSYHVMYEDLELKTALGIGMLHTNTTVQDEEISSRAEVRGRAGLGLQYNFTKEINANYDLLIQGGNKDFHTHLNNFLSLRYNFI